MSSVETRVGAALVPQDPHITPSMDRRNGLLFASTYIFIYLAAPVIYVGVVSAALCDKLGASATVANLPASAYLFGAIAPFVLSWMLPARLDRAVVVVSNLVTAASMMIVCVTLLLPFSDTIRIAAVIVQGLVQGVSGNISAVYTYQCLGRGTTIIGRARAMKITFSLGPIAAVVGSLGAQFLLDGGVPSLRYPYDFGMLYAVGIPCSLAVAFLSAFYQLAPIAEQPEREAFLRYLVDSIRSYVRDRDLVLLWFGYLLWYLALNAMPNMSLYAREAVGRDPKELSGIMLALQFGFKALGGFVLGAIGVRWGVRAPVIWTVLLLAIGTLWAWFAPGYAYLLAFGFLGAGELGGAYFPNYQVALSTPATGARDLSLQSLVSPVSSVAPAIHGALTDHFGFRASFAFGILSALGALALVLRVPAEPGHKTTRGKATG